MSANFEELVGNAILGIDTLWGGDVMCASGTGRFIADSWFSDQALPRAYTTATAARVRESGGVGAKVPDWEAIDAYLAEVDIPAAIGGLKDSAAWYGGLRGEYLAGLALCFQAMWDLAMEILGKGDAVPYERCVIASTGLPPEPSDAVAKRERVAELLGCAATDSEGLIAGVETWRKQHRVPMASIQLLGAAVIGYFDDLTAQHVVPYLPKELHGVPRAKIEFLAIRDAWFSGFDELPWARAAAGGRTGVRGDLRDQRIAGHFAARIHATGEPRSGTGPRDDVRVPAESLLAGPGGIRGVGIDDEYAGGDAF